MEEFIVEELVKAIKKTPNLKITILLDKERSERWENGNRAMTMLTKLTFEVILYF